MAEPRFSRHRYDAFVRDYKAKRLDELIDREQLPQRRDSETDRKRKKGLRNPRSRAHVRQYLRWLKPHRAGLLGVSLLALVVAGLQMIEPLFTRFIVDRILLQKLDTAERMRLLNLAGGVFVAVILGSRLIGVLKDYRQRLLNTKVMLSLRKALYDRLLNIPLPSLWVFAHSEKCWKANVNFWTKPSMPFENWKRCLRLVEALLRICSGESSR